MGVQVGHVFRVVLSSAKASQTYSEQISTLHELESQQHHTFLIHIHR
jgi:hypothetical protein